MGWLTMGKSAFGMLFFSSLNGISLQSRHGREEKEKKVPRTGKFTDVGLRLLSMEFVVSSDIPVGVDNYPFP